MRDQQHTRTYYERQLRELKDRLLIMSSQAESMISDSIRSFVDRRPTLAAEVIERDDEMDRLEMEIDNLCYEILALEQAVRKALSYMLEDPRSISRALKLIFIAKHLERVGDHATNIAEMVVFLVRGQDIRHRTHLAG